MMIDEKLKEQLKNIEDYILSSSIEEMFALFLEYFNELLNYNSEKLCEIANYLEGGSIFVERERTDNLIKFIKENWWISYSDILGGIFINTPIGLPKYLSDAERSIIKNLRKRSQKNDDIQKKEIAAFVIFEFVLEREPRSFFNLFSIESYINLMHKVEPEGKAGKIKKVFDDYVSYMYGLHYSSGKDRTDLWLANDLVFVLWNLAYIQDILWKFLPIFKNDAILSVKDYMENTKYHPSFAITIGIGYDEVTVPLMSAVRVMEELNEVTSDLYKKLKYYSDLATLLWFLHANTSDETIEWISGKTDKNKEVQKLLLENPENMIYDNQRSRLFFFDWFLLERESQKKFCEIANKDEERKKQKLGYPEDMDYYLFSVRNELEQYLKQDSVESKINVELARGLITRMEKQYAEDNSVLYFKGILAVVYDNNFDEARRNFNKIFEKKDTSLIDWAIPWLMFMDLQESNYDGAVEWMEKILYYGNPHGFELLVKLVKDIMTKYKDVQDEFYNFLEKVDADYGIQMNIVTEKEKKLKFFSEALRKRNIDFDDIVKTQIERIAAEDLGEKTPDIPKDEERKKIENILKDRLGPVYFKLDEATRNFLIFGEASYSRYIEAKSDMKQASEIGVQWYLNGVAAEIYHMIFKPFKADIRQKYLKIDYEKLKLHEDWYKFYKYIKKDEFTPTLANMAGYIKTAKAYRSKHPIFKKLFDLIRFKCPEMLKEDCLQIISKMNAMRNDFVHPKEFDSKRINFKYVRNSIIGKKEREGLLTRMLLDKA